MSMTGEKGTEEQSQSKGTWKGGMIRRVASVDSGSYRGIVGVEAMNLHPKKDARTR